MSNRQVQDRGHERLGAVPVELVDEHGVGWGRSDKLSVHQQPGMLHRAVSVAIVRANGDVLLQRRALNKYHFAGWWANACCTHPFPGEAASDAAGRCVRVELGIDVRLEPAGSFVYWASDPHSGRVEYEYDDVFLGLSDEEPQPNPAEIAEVLWCPQRELDSKLDELRPFAPWARTVIGNALAAWNGLAGGRASGGVDR